MQCHFLGTAFLFIRGDSVHSTQDSWLNSRIGITCGSGCSDCFRYGSECCSGSDFSDCSGSGCCSGYGFPFEKSSVILFAVFRTFSIPSYKRFIRRICRRQANRRFLWIYVEQTTANRATRNVPKSGGIHHCRIFAFFNFTFHVFLKKFVQHAKIF